MTPKTDSLPETLPAVLLNKAVRRASFGSTDNSEDADVSSEEGDSPVDESEMMNIFTSTRSVVGNIVPLISTNPEPLPERYWTEPDASSFKVRGAKYGFKDRKKVPSAENLFRLIAVDLVQVSKPILSGMCAHPDERVQRGLRAEKEGRPGSKMPPFIFCINITVPGKDAYHAVIYYAVDDISLIKPSAEGGTSSPFNKLASKFFYGDSDDFRQSTFKLIPRIAKGNFVVKNAVGNKPTILGRKVKNHYIRNERFFELIVDVGSDPIAKRVVGLCLGYAKTLVVDMGFVLEGRNKATLPENLMGTVRLNNLDFKADLRFVEQP